MHQFSLYGKSLQKSYSSSWTEFFYNYYYINPLSFFHGPNKKHLLYMPSPSSPPQTKN